MLAIGGVGVFGDGARAHFTREGGVGLGRTGRGLLAAVGDESGDGGAHHEVGRGRILKRTGEGEQAHEEGSEAADLGGSGKKALTRR